MKKNLIAIIALLAFLIVSCQNPAVTDQAIETAETYASFEDFRASEVQEYKYDNVNSRYLVENCLIFESIERVENYYNNEMAKMKAGASGHLINGQLDKWTASQRQNLTYTISSSFGGNESTVRNYFSWGTEEWEAVVDVNYTEVSSNGLFEIRPATFWEELFLRGVIAAAFFPNEGGRELIVFDDFFTLDIVPSWNDDLEKKYTAAHELGHTLGLRHEHIWTNGKQTEETSAPAQLLTSQQDTASIMYYPHMSGYTGNGYISSMDIQGVNVLY